MTDQEQRLFEKLKTAVAIIDSYFEINGCENPDVQGYIEIMKQEIERSLLTPRPKERLQ